MEISSEDGNGTCTVDMLMICFFFQVMVHEWIMNEPLVVPYLNGKFMNMSNQFLFTTELDAQSGNGFDG